MSELPKTATGPGLGIISSMDRESRWIGSILTNNMGLREDPVRRSVSAPPELSVQRPFKSFTSKSSDDAPAEDPRFPAQYHASYYNQRTTEPRRTAFKEIAKHSNTSAVKKFERATTQAVEDLTKRMKPLKISSKHTRAASLTDPVAVSTAPSSNPAFRQTNEEYRTGDPDYHSNDREYHADLRASDHEYPRASANGPEYYTGKPEFQTAESIKQQGSVPADDMHDPYKPEVPLHHAQADAYRSEGPYDRYDPGYEAHPLSYPLSMPAPAPPASHAYYSSNAYPPRMAPPLSPYGSPQYGPAHPGYHDYPPQDPGYRGEDGRHWAHHRSAEYRRSQYNHPPLHHSSRGPHYPHPPPPPPYHGYHGGYPPHHNYYRSRPRPRSPHLQPPRHRDHPRHHYHHWRDDRQYPEYHDYYGPDMYHDHSAPLGYDEWYDDYAYRDQHHQSRRGGSRGRHQRERSRASSERKKHGKHHRYHRNEYRDHKQRGGASKDLFPPPLDLNSGSTNTASSSLGGALSPQEASTKEWLENFRINGAQNSELTLQDVIDESDGRPLLIELAADQYGSRFIQQCLEDATASEKQAAFEEILPHTLRLCTDVFGNYVIQKFLEHGSTQQQRLICGKLINNVLPLSLQMCGCRVVQKAMDVADVETQKLLVRELVGHVIPCVKDQNGNHVIQKCIEKVPNFLIQFIVEAFSTQVLRLSTHPYGCRVIQRLLEHCSDKQRLPMLREILQNVKDLCKNQFGNYVVQHVLKHGDQWQRVSVVTKLRGNLHLLSRHKFASNVVEKAFAYCGPKERELMINETMGDMEDDGTRMVALIKDQYGNYVVQKIIDVASEEHKQAIVARIQRYLPQLMKIPYGKHIIARAEKITGKPMLPASS